MPDPNDLLDTSTGSSHSSRAKRSKGDESPRAASIDATVNAIDIGGAAPAAGGTTPTASKKKRGGAARAPKGQPKAADAEPKGSTLSARPNRVPDSVAERFIQIGNNFFFPDGADAFTDHGNRVTTRSENTVVIQSMVAIARDRAQGEMTVQGTDFFKKEAWFAAKLAGLDVQGYEPTALEQERLVRAVARRQAATKTEDFAMNPDTGATQDRDHDGAARPAGESPKSRSRERPPNEGERIVGRLVDHGQAHYHHKSNQPMSYYVRIETDRGDREVWGVDLERAFRQSLSTPGVGDEVGLRAVGRDPVTVPAVKRDADGREVGREEIRTHRNQWILERKDFLDRRLEMAELFCNPSVSAAQAVERYPELEGSYLQLQIARAGTEQRVPNAALREQFVNHLRAHLARTIEYGQALEPVHLRARAGQEPEPEKVLDRDFAPTR